MTTIDTESSTEKLIRLQEETLFFLNMVKNSQAVRVGDNQILTRLFTGQKIFVDASDISVSPALIMDGYWEREVTTLLTKILRPSDCFIDLGANMGYFGIVAGTVIRGDEGGSIHMIEANPDLVPLIFKSINVTGLLGTAVVANFAVTDTVGEVQLQVVKDLLGSSSLNDLDTQFRLVNSSTSAVGFEVAEKVTVPSITLDEYAAMESMPKVDLVKMDIEGYEEHAYRGMQRIVAENRDNLRLLLEFTPTRYPDSEGFYHQLAADFSHVLGLDPNNGSLIPLTTYDELLAMSASGYVMVLATNQQEIHL
ncbi:MAG: FkbM family methyltransferase [Actinomycetota bacterium]